MFTIIKDKNRKTRLRFKTDNKDLNDLLREEYQVANPAVKFSPYAAEFLSPISPLGSFQVGLSYDILRWVKKNFPNEKIKIEQDILNIIKPSYKFDKIKQPNNTDYVLRDYQEETVKLALKNGRGTFELATSAGKSLIIHSIIENIWEIENKQKTVLILVPTVQLVKQFNSDLIDYGIGEENIKMFSSFSPDDPTSPIIISNRQWLQNHASKLPMIDICITDEAHQLKTNSKVSKFVGSLNTHNKFAFTGTLPEDQINRWNVIGLNGDVHYAIKAHELQSTGAVADTNIVSILIDHKEPQPEYTESTDPLEIAKKRFPLEWKFIESSWECNKFMVDMCLKMKGNTIVLFDHVEHGNLFKSICEKFNENKQIFFVDGSVPLNYRENVRTLMEHSDDCLLLAQTKTFGTGTSIKNIKNICFAFTAGTSTTKIVQAIGRGLRLRDGKTEMFLYDFYHNFKYSKQHYTTRKKMYDEHYNSKTFRELEYDLKNNKMRKIATL
jgi:superfamily II DNA or RNA helicase